MPAIPAPDSILLNLLLAAVAGALALWVRPWRALGDGGPPAVWLAAWAVLPLLWGVDRFIEVPIAVPMSGASLLVLLAGWPLAIMALFPVSAMLLAIGDLSGAEALYRLVWLGVVPATLVLGIGAALRQWLPHHLFVYILGRGFFGTLVASTLAGVAALAVHAPPAGLMGSEMVVARVLMGFGEAFLTGALVAIFVAFRPHWLATYADRLYLPPHPPQPPVA